MRTRRSYHAACPVIGSAFIAMSPSRPGKVSPIRWFNRKPLVNSGESAARFQAPGRLPIAFQVHTVFGLTPSISFSCASMRPAWLDTQTQSSSARPRVRAVTRFMNRRFWPRIWRALAVRVAIGAAPAGERADAGRALVQGDVVLVAAGIARRSIRSHEGGQAEPRSHLDQDILERPHIAVGGDDRLSN